MQMRREQRNLVLTALLLATFPAAAFAEVRRFDVRVEAGETARNQTPVHVDLQLPEGFVPKNVSLSDTSNKSLPAMVVRPSLLNAQATKGEARWVLWFVLPELAAEQSATFTAEISSDPIEEDRKAIGFSWKSVAGDYDELLYGDRSVARYMNKAYVWDADANKRDLNNKPFHHLFDPAGKRMVTKGSGGFYTHHQGLFYGFTRCTLADGSKQNLWYCHEGEHMLHKRTIEQIAGPVMGRHRTEIDWNDVKGQPFCREERELAAFATQGGTLVEWSSRLKSLRGDVLLDGDPQHAGFQFRADNEVNDRLKEKLTYYLRTDGKGKPGETRNWPDNKQMTDLPWNAMSFVLGETRYTAVYLDSPRNPKPSFYSERDYGRFGSWFGKQNLAEGGATVDITYRIWLQEGEMTPEQATTLSRDFATPPKVTATTK